MKTKIYTLVALCSVGGAAQNVSAGIYISADLQNADAVLWDSSSRSVLQTYGSGILAGPTSACPYLQDQIAVADVATSKLEFFDTITGAHTNSVQLPFAPFSVTSTNPNHLVVWSQNARQGIVLEADSLATICTFYAPTGANYRGLTEVGGGLYGIDPASGSIHRFGLEGGLPEYISQSPSNSNYGIYTVVPSLMLDGYLYTATRNGGNVNGAQIRRFLPSSTPIYDESYVTGGAAGFRYTDAFAYDSMDSFVGLIEDPGPGGQYVASFDAVTGNMIPGSTWRWWTGYGQVGNIAPMQSPVPEPMTASILLFGTLGFYLVKRRRK